MFKDGRCVWSNHGATGPTATNGIRNQLIALE